MSVNTDASRSRFWNGIPWRSERQREDCRMRAVAGLLIVALLLAGCAHPSSTTYETGDVGRTIETTQASIVSSRLVNIAGSANALGPLAGGALGAAGSGLAFRSSGLIAVLGAVLLAAGRSAGRVTVPCRLKFCSCDGPTVSDEAGGAAVTSTGASLF